MTGFLARLATLVPVCPEVELGLGAPREPIRLERHGRLVRLVAPGSGTDHTEAMRRYAERRVAELEGMALSGYVLKSDSPSCGMERVPTWRGGAAGQARTGRGAFARVLLARLPLVPVEEEGRLRDLALRENFVERVLACARVRALLEGGPGPGDLLRFHRAEELLVRAHDPAACLVLDRLVARASRGSRGGEEARELARRYAERYTRALAKVPTRARHAGVLLHMERYVEGAASADELQELRGAIADYRRGIAPLAVPLTLLRHRARRHGIAELVGQRYLELHPMELMLTLRHCPGPGSILRGGDRR